MNVLSFIDPSLLPWVVVANVFGYWLKKEKLPGWFPPIPLVIFLANFLICSVIGWALTDAEGWKAIIIALLDYGIGNGLVITLISTFGYDVVHSFTKRSSEKKAEEAQDV